ncbi:MAG: hypothetical protein A2252_11090 [Elusimicrobia bacterium RIFOXYA2_FULL_39_19]|nr:MAG: hypothetical protein A2252_11090 [Elusimicrobia bacterium RIFOXYA2_FULL_39_19]
MDYNVHLEIFEGPLDLLLYLIKKNDLDIYDIPISNITAQYLEYIEIMKELNLDVASEFLIMAATLMQIKAKTLLPTNAVEEDEGPDPREELTKKLLEYQKFKQAAQFLELKEFAEKGAYYKNAPVFSEEDYVMEANLFDLLESFKEVIKELPEKIKEIIFEEIPIERKIREIMGSFDTAPQDNHGRKYLIFRDLLKQQKTRLNMIVLFLAILELIRLKQTVARQTMVFGEIRLYLNESSLKEAQELSANYKEETKNDIGATETAELNKPDIQEPDKQAQETVVLEIQPEIQEEPAPPEEMPEEAVEPEEPPVQENPAEEIIENKTENNEIINKENLESNGQNNEKE